MAIEYICTYNDYLDSFGLLSDEEFGRLIRAGIRYNAMGELTELEGSLGVAFAVMRAQIDRDRKRYDKRCEKNRENALRRCAKDGGSETDDGSDGSDRYRSLAMAANNKTKTNTNTKNNNNTNTKTNNNNNTNNKKIPNPRGEADPYGPFGPLGTCGALRYSFYTGHGADKGAEAAADKSADTGANKNEDDESRERAALAKKLIDAAVAAAERNRRSVYGK